MSKRYKMIVAYDGTDYEGWQSQLHGKSIADALRSSFLQAFRQNIKIVGASRTDAGVHAHHQVAAFNATLPLCVERVRSIWNKRLASSILIRSLEEINDNFDPRRDVLQKTYCYKIFLNRPSPFASRYGYFLKYADSLNVQNLEEALAIFVGTHDFRSFCTGWEMKSTLRTIDEIKYVYDTQENSYSVIIKGKSFLRYMIRRIIGASLQVSMGHRSLEMLQNALHNKLDPQQLLFNAPPEGLILVDIQYYKEKAE